MVAEGSKISCVNGEVLVELVTEGMYAYTYDENQHLTIRKVLGIKDGGLQSCVKVGWSPQGGRTDPGFVIVTPETMFVKSDGNTITPANLEDHTSLLHVHRGMDTFHERVRIYAHGHKDRLEEQIVGTELLGAGEGAHIHHINFDHSDNRPENLVVAKTNAEHQHYHTLENEKKGAEDVKERIRRAALAESSENHWSTDQEYVEEMMQVYTVILENGFCFIANELAVMS